MFLIFVSKQDKTSQTCSFILAWVRCYYDTKEHNVVTVLISGNGLLSLSINIGQNILKAPQPLFHVKGDVLKVDVTVDLSSFQMRFLMSLHYVL